MTIKPRHLLRLLLLIPYFAWGIALLFVFLFITPASNTNTPNAVIETIGGVVTMFTLGIVLWGIPYTILSVGLSLWSIHKPVNSIYKAFLFSPILLAILMAIEVTLVSFWPQQVMSSTGLTDFLSYVLIVVIPSLLFGYAFVGVGVLLYQATRRLNLIRAEPEPSQA